MSEKLSKMNLLNFSVWNLILTLSYVVTVISGERFNSDVTFVRNKKTESKDNNNIIDMSKRCSNARNTDALLSRKKRALSFPNGSFFVITLSLVKALLLGIPLGWNISLEIDVFFKTPSFVELEKMKVAGPIKHLLQHHRQRREAWGQFEEVLKYYGVKGQPCILRAICEAQRYLAPKNTFLSHDVLKLIFSAPDHGMPADEYTEAHNTDDCKIFEEECPFSLLELLLSYTKT